MIDEIRSYFTARIKEVDPDFKFDGELFGTETASSTQLNRSYSLIIGASAGERLDTSYQRTFSTTVNIFSRSGTNAVADHDKVYCKALDLAANCEDQLNINQTGFIKSVLETGITPEPIAGDDNSVKFEIQFNVTTYYSIEQ